jgi:hypothetical protein
MAFYIGTDKVIEDTDATSGISTRSDLDVLRINGTDVLTHSGGVITLQNVDISNSIEDTINTDNVTEGTTNIFFTNARADARINLQTGSNLDLGSKDTDFLPEGSTNLYYTNARWDTRLGTKTTTDLTEGTNLYYTDTRSRSAISVSGDLAYNSTTGVISFSATAAPVISVNSATGSVVLDTDDIAEGSTNLYYTDARVQAKIDAVVDSAPAALDTLNELAAALGDDANFSGTVTTALAGKLPLAGGTMTGTLVLDGAPTSNLHAATKAYVDSAVTGGTGTLTTDNISEGSTNLYFTNARADARIPTTVSTFTNDSGYVTTNTTYTAGNGLSLSGTEFLMSGSYTGSFTATGDITAYSDERLKRNIETINKPIDIVNSLRGVTYEKDGRDSVGVIAQETELALPQVVHTDAEGMKSVAYGNISGVLIEAIKEQQKTIDGLQKQVTDLQTLYMMAVRKKESE